MNYKTNIKRIIYSLFFIGCANISHLTLTMNERQITKIIVVSNDNTALCCDDNNTYPIEVTITHCDNNILIQNRTESTKYIDTPLTNFIKHDSFNFLSNLTTKYINGITASGRIFIFSDTIKKNMDYLLPNDYETTIQSIYFTTNDGNFHVWHKSNTLLSSCLAIGILAFIFYYFVKIRS